MTAEWPLAARKNRSPPIQAAFQMCAGKSIS